MRNTIILILFIACPILAFSQKEDKGLVDAKYKVTYSINYISDTIKMTKGTEDWFILLIGDGLTYGYSYLYFQFDSLLSAPYGAKKFAENYLDNVKKGIPPMRYSSDLMNAKLYKDYKKILTVLDHIATDYFMYQEELMPQNWIIKDDTMTIAEYACQRAQCSWRGRDYEAWFTTEIPISEGPWKFFGLPGLIVKLYDTKHQYEFELVEFKNTDEKIDVRPLYTQKTTGFSKCDLTKIDRIKFLQMKYGEKGKIISKIDLDKIGIVNDEPVRHNYDYIERDYK